MHFLLDPLKIDIFYSNHFLYILPIKPESKHLLATHDYYLMFETFSFQVNNKGDFWGGDPTPKVGSSGRSPLVIALLIN